MNGSEMKIVQYLGEAHATEHALLRMLQSQIAMTPRGAYRTALEQHLRETEDHARRVGERLQELGGGVNPLTAAVSTVSSMVGQLFAFSKAPYDMLRGSGGEEKVLRNAKDAYTSEALEIATYTAIERLASAVGDEQTAKLAASILADEQKMLERVLREIPKLTDAVVRAELKGKPSYDPTTTGAADAVREAGEAASEAAKETVRTADKTAKNAARQARKLPGVAQAEGQFKGALATEDDLAIARYDDLTVQEINAKLPELSQIDLAKVDGYERKRQSRSTILGRISSLRADEPWPGYDELTAEEIQRVLSDGDDDLAQEIHAYERAHKSRAGVLKAAGRELANA